MGGQETLLLVARHPRLLAGAAAFDSVTNLALQYHNFDLLVCRGACRRIWAGTLGPYLQTLAADEVGGTPTSDPGAYRRRSPIDHAREIAFSRVPLQLWWSVADGIVRDQAEQTGELFWTIKRLNPAAPVAAFVGSWMHTHEMRADSRLTLALAIFGLLPSKFLRVPHRLHYVPASRFSLLLEQRGFEP